METLLLIWVGLSGLAIGSFLNVVIYRVPRNIKFIKARSKCPYCSQQLCWYHNIPIISYIFLKGRCAFCLKKISIRYPMIEILNALFFLYFFWQFGFSTNFFIFAAISSSLIAIFFIDMDFQIIPDIITLPGMI
ncbi:MAG: prepilin peptidase, partial [Candidatus Zixiibacteriota bacterium]